MRTGVAFLVFAAALSAPPSGAWATMPMLTDLPTKKTAQSCFDWAKAQDEDAHEMWGMKADGPADAELGVLRLAVNCKSGEKPEEVGLGSSVGYDKAYCAKHPKASYCKGSRSK